MSGSGFPVSETAITLYLLTSPASTPADCDAIRNDSSSEELGSATASAGAATISGVSVGLSFVRGANNHLCLHGASFGASSPVVTFEATPTIVLSPPSVSMGSLFLAHGIGFDASESVSLHLVASPASTPADCDAVRNAAGSLNLYSSTALSGGIVSIIIHNVDSRFAEGSENYLCLYGNSSNASSAVVQLHVGAPTVESVEFTSTPESGGDTYEHGEHVEITLTFGYAVTMDAGESIRIELAAKTYARAFSVASDSLSTSAAFRYTVAAGTTPPQASPSSAAAVRFPASRSGTRTATPSPPTTPRSTATATTGSTPVRT